MKICTILGARPQFIKAVSLSRKVKEYKLKGVDIEEIIIHTGQHYDDGMSKVFFEEMGIPKPNYYLNFGNLSHGAMTGRMIEEIEKILLDYMPDWVVVYGDTNSTLAGAIATSKLNIKLAHVEAGLRSKNNLMPEEINRIITDRVSNILFCSTTQSIENLKNEGVDSWVDTQYFLSGDIMLESTNHFKNSALKPTNISIKNNFILTTIHRAENTNDPEKLSNIFDSLKEISKENQVILPLHPRTSNILKKNNINTKGITLIPPVGFINMAWLLSNCLAVVTDSGGLQKEAYFHKKPCLTLREETEWVELVENGVNILSSWHKSDILNSFEKTLLIPEDKFDKEFYGDGNCSTFILEKLMNYESNE